MENTKDHNCILVVEDDKAHRQLVGTFIDRMGICFDSAKNGVEALQKLKSGRFNLVITDIKMPEMDGFELLVQLKNDESVDVIVMTGFIDDYEYIDIIQAGAADFINKPINNGEFAAKIYRVFQERDLIEDVKKNKDMLTIKANELEESNTALRILIRNIEQEKKDMEEDFHTAITARITPFINKLERFCDDDEQKKCIEGIRSNINDLTSPITRLSFAKKVQLTVNELQVVDLVQKGLTSKEIADIMNISFRTVEKYRGKIRKKCGISNSKVNLKNILSS